MKKAKKNHVWIVEMWNPERRKPKYETMVGVGISREEGRVELKRWKQKCQHDRFRLHPYIAVLAILACMLCLEGCWPYFSEQDCLKQETTLAPGYTIQVSSLGRAKLFDPDGDYCWLYDSVEAAYRGSWAFAEEAEKKSKEVWYTNGVVVKEAK